MNCVGRSGCTFSSELRTGRSLSSKVYIIFFTVCVSGVTMKIRSGYLGALVLWAIFYFDIAQLALFHHLFI